MKENIKIAHMKSALNYADLSYCTRLKVGCLVVKDDRIISIGFNGTPKGWDNVCEDENNNSHPYVLHAELNAIAKLAKSNESGEGSSVFVTHSPCYDCAKLLAQIGVKEVFYTEEYRTTDGIDFLKKCGITVEKLSVK